jgi:hypothetical protein
MCCGVESDYPDSVPAATLADGNANSVYVDATTTVEYLNQLSSTAGIADDDGSAARNCAMLLNNPKSRSSDRTPWRCS